MSKKTIRLMETIRWAFRCGEWQPSREQWLKANSCVQPEERERISKFVFKKDAKAAMCGRLLLRKAISSSLTIPYKDIKLLRTDKGKPYLRNDPKLFPNFNFNVSHQGSLAVIAAEPAHQVGIDVMKIEYPRGSKTTEEFFDTMERQFTEHEWETIKEPIDEWEQLANFYRHWCLKESYVKATGTGIGFSLQRLDFHPQSPLDPGTSVSDTKVYVDGKLDKGWVFQETMLDNVHCGAVALQQVSEEPLPKRGSSFKTLTFTQLMEGSEVLDKYDEQLWLNFDKKQETPGGRNS